MYIVWDICQACVPKSRASVQWAAVTQICGPEYQKRHACFNNQLQWGLAEPEWIITRLICFFFFFFFLLHFPLQSFSLYNHLFAGLHPIARWKKWFSWSWATLTQTFSFWWASWKVSTALWRFTRTTSKYKCFSSLFYCSSSKFKKGFRMKESWTYDLITLMTSH